MIPEKQEQDDSAVFFNTDRIVRREREKQLEKRRLTAIEQAISIDVSEVIDSIQFPQNKEEMFINISKQIEEVETGIRMLKGKINIISQIDSQKKSDHKFLTKENFAFLKNLLFELNYIKKKDLITMKQLFEELKKNKQKVRQFQVQDESSNKRKKKKKERSNISKYLQAMNIEKEEVREQLEGEQKMIPISSLQKLVQKQVKIKQQKVNEEKRKYRYDEKSGRERQRQKQKCKGQNEKCKLSESSQKSRRQVFENKTQFVYRVKSILADRIIIIHQKVQLQIEYQSVTKLSFLSYIVHIVVNDFNFRVILLGDQMSKLVNMFQVFRVQV